MNNCEKRMISCTRMVSSSNQTIRLRKPSIIFSIHVPCGLFRYHSSALILMLMACNQSGGLNDISSKPNIIFILADDWGWGDLSCHGHQQYKTPNLDQLASEGIDFHNFYVSGSVCSPSRAGILTGHFPSRFGIHNALSMTNNLNAKMGSADWLDPDAPTIARFLQEAGYTTAHFGKWHLTGEDGKASDAPTPDAYGFDKWLTMRGPESWPLSGMRSELTEEFQGDGENMLDTWSGNPKQRNTPLFWIQKNQGEWFLATRVDNYKLIMNENQSIIELYDLRQDRSEKYNIASLSPEVVDRLSRLTFSWKASLPPEANPECISIYRNKE